MKNQRILAMGAAAAAFAGVLAGGVVASHGGGVSSASALVADAGSRLGLADTPAPGGAADRQANQDAYLQKLAGHLGIDVTKLKDALKQTSLEEVGQRLADGSITKEMADNMRTAINNGDYFFGPGGGHGKEGPYGGPGAVRPDDQALAQFLGIDQATLKQKLDSGKTLATIATEAGKSRDALKAFLSAQAASSLKDAVASGRTTQAQADAELAELTARLDAMIDGQGHGGEHGGDRGGPRGPMTPGQSQPGTSSSQ